MAGLQGAIAAAATPMRDGGAAVDEESIERLVTFLARAGLDGLLSCGTAGEGMLLSVAERQRVTELMVQARPAGFRVAVHAGAQTTADTVELASHAEEVGADAVAAIAPPYFALSNDELFHHFSAAADAADPLPFYIYEFAERSGYAIPPEVIQRVQRSCPNLAGLKVSDRPLEAAMKYQLPGLNLFIGWEPFVRPAQERGAKGAVSGLATAFPELIRNLVRGVDPAAPSRVAELRLALTGMPFHAALKYVLVKRGVIPHGDVRRPLLGLIEAERTRLDALVP
ncbi:MAG TPA: dihydrodipicolinate synthase family protein [Actinomycetota bacterium]|jgi:dihydrodipicolinate synthase/N-acetylneuraminate lyase